jgi:hypothetical protein
MKRALTMIAAAVPALLRDALGLTGVGLIAYGAWLVYRPAGAIVLGAMLVIGVVLTARGGD